MIIFIIKQKRRVKNSNFVQNLFKLAHYDDKTFFLNKKIILTNFLKFTFMNWMKKKIKHIFNLPQSEFWIHSTSCFEMKQFAKLKKKLTCELVSNIRCLICHSGA